MKLKFISLLKYNKFKFGNQIVSQFVIFECKYLFSIIIFYFHKSDGHQDRFHTHAFNAISFKLFGQYDEHVLIDENTGKYDIRRRKQIIQYFPRNSYHRIAKSNGCCTILLSGKWNKTWKEYIDGKIKIYSWNRKEL